MSEARERATVASVVGIITILLAAGNGGGVASYGSFGIPVKAGDRDHGWVLSTLPAGTDGFLAMRELGSAGTIDNAFYLHFGTGATTTIQQDTTFRLIPGTGGTGTGGQWVIQGAADIGQSWLNPDGTAFTGATPIAGRVKYLEVDGHNGFTPGISSSDGDLAVLDMDLSATINAGDIALNTVSATGVQVTQWTVIQATSQVVAEANDGDDDYPISPALAGTFVVRIYESRNDGRTDRNDVVFLKETVSATASRSLFLPDVGDLCIQPSTTIIGLSITCSLVTNSATFMKPLLVREVPFLACTDCGNPDFTLRKLYIHFADPDGVNDHILRNDIVIARGTGSTIGQRVSGTTNGEGEPIDVIVADIAANLFWLELDSITGFTPRDGVYLKLPAGMGGGAGTCPGAPCLAQFDRRITPITAGTTSYTAGTPVRTGEQDLSAFGGQTGAGFGGFHFKSYDADKRRAIQLNGLSASVTDGLGVVAGTWEPATECVYQGGGGTVTNGLTRLYTGAGPCAAFAPLSVTDCETAVTPGIDGDCATAITANSKMKVTGSDATFTSGRSECIYQSNDAIVNGGDERVIGACGGIGATTALGDADTLGPITNAAGTNDKQFFSLDAGCPGTCFPLILIQDVRQNSWGQFAKDTETDVVPRVTLLGAGGAPANPTLIRNNRGDAVIVTDDTFYHAFGAALSANRDIRASPMTSSAAGTFVQPQDTQDLQGTLTTDGADLTVRLAYIEADNIAGFTKDDIVVADTSAALGGSGNGALDQNDLRVKDYPVGSTVFKAGTFARAPDLDVTTFTAFTCPGAGCAGGAFRIYWADLNNDGAINRDDQLWIQFGAAPAINVPTLNWIRMNGQSGTTTSTGGGTTTTTTTTTTTPTTTPASITISQPATGSYKATGQAFIISGTASGGSYSLTSVALTVNGASVTITGTTSWSTTFTPATDGNYAIVATAQTTGGTPSASATITANAAGTAPPAMQTCPDGSQVLATEDCPAEDTEAREAAAAAQESADEARDLAQEAKDASEQAAADAEAAKDAAEGAKAAAEETGDAVDELIARLNESGGDTSVIPGPGPLIVLGAVGAAMVLRKRRIE